ncbi:MAG: methyltransferase domain-containing protein [Candidatus Electrothrix sp. AX5]|nr:methyltransferase domain-containing protein [Candidatus Electrothrix sp. AX5]
MSLSSPPLIMSKLIENFDHYILSIPLESITKKIGQATGKPTRYTQKTIETYINEARAALNFIHPLLSHRNAGILEVGAGICILSLFLKKEGFNIVALEPATAGFGFFSTFQRIFIEHYKEIALEILPYPAKDLREKDVGTFDLIFSFNVIEHIPDPLSTLYVLLNVLNRKGKMAHSCPNYSIPFEPHFGIPVLVSWPGLTYFLFFKKISRNKELWKSLNFITYQEIKKFTHLHNLTVSFQQGLLYKVFSRIENDPIFRERQKSFFIMTLFLILRSTGAINLLKILPPRCATPMQFIISKS